MNSNENLINKSNFVLIVDDIEVNLKLISEILKKNNIRTITANSGKRALELAKEKLPDLILLDISMPELDGFKVCQKLKEDIDTKHIPVIFLSARSQTEDVVKGLNIGAVDYLTKPYKPQELLSRVLTHLDLKNAKDIINKQNDTLKQTNEQHTKSLKFAQHIQEKLLPKKNIIEKHLDDYFIFFHPKYMVSGDFYWFAYQQDLIFLAVADCTGHGIPGALMSMIGNTLLNEIIIKNKIYNPADILRSLDSEVLKTLNKGNEDQQFDNEGMDISICVIDKRKKEIKISCANQDIYYFQNNELHTIEGQYISIGGSSFGNGQLEFITHTIKIDQPTYFYMLTDGFQDQFGGPDNEKYQIKVLRELLINNYKLSSSDQEKLIKSQFIDWKASIEQTDDILILGFKADWN